MSAGRQVHLYFRSNSGEDPSRALRLELDLISSPLATKWWFALRKCLDTYLALEKSFLLVGVPRADRTWDDIHLDLRRNLKLLGLALDPHRELDRDKLNELHHEFEVRIGQVWNPNPSYLKADFITRHAIRQINHLVHEAEALADLKSSGTPKPAVLAAFFGAPRTLLTNSDLAEFQLQTSFGDVFLHYCQLGKTHLEAFNDNDTHIADENINGLRYFTGEFDIYFRPSSSKQEINLLKNRLSSWLRNQRLDPHDPRLAIGHALVARLSERSKERIPNPKTAIDCFAKQPDLFRIECTEDGAVVSRRDYRYSIAQCDQLILGISQDSPVKRVLFNWGRRWQILEQALLR